MPDIKIPENSIELIDEMYNLANDVMNGCGFCLSYEKTPDVPKDIFDECYHKIKIFIIQLNYFPHRWSKFDPLLWGVEVDSWGFRYFFRFFIPDSPPEFGKEELFYIPYELYLLFRDLKFPDEEGTEKSDYYYHAFNLAEHVIQSLDSLKSILKLRIKCLNGDKVIEHKNTENQGNAKSINDDPQIIDNGRVLKCKKGEFKFTKRQATIIRIYFENYQNGNDFKSEQTALEEADEMMRGKYSGGDPGYSRTRFVDIFKRKKFILRELFEQDAEVKDLWRLKLE